MNNIEEVYLVWESSFREYKKSWPKDFHCPRPCSLCCEQSPLVPVSPVEAVLVSQFIHNRFLDEKKQVVINRAQQIVSQLESNTAFYDISKVANSISPSGKISGGCPLLFDGLCSVYEVRPLVCRAFGFSAEEREEPDSRIVYMGCSILEDILKKYKKISLPSWSAAWRLIPDLKELDKSKKELPKQSTLAEMILRLL